MFRVHLFIMDLDDVLVFDVASSITPLMSSVYA